MTDNEIIKALGCYSCMVDGLHENALDLIKRQITEIERLETEKDNLIRAYRECQIEVLREFAEKLKEKSHYHNCRYNGAVYDITAIEVKEIDNLVKEMTGGE